MQKQPPRSLFQPNLFSVVSEAYIYVLILKFPGSNTLLFCMMKVRVSLDQRLDQVFLS